MIADHSITNILCVSGISNIRFRAYTQSCTRGSLISFLQCDNNKENNVLLETYRHMISLNIPSVWRIKPTKSDTLTLELWVFWFEDRHTGQVDASINHNDLQEIAVGSLNWDQFMSKKSTPFDLDSSEDYKLEIKPEYKLFIKAIRNLIQQSMIQAGRFCLGEFYVFPNINYHADSESTMLACMYNIYLCSTNLVFQPNARRMRIRPLSMMDKNSVGLKVLLSPTGNPARLIRFLTQPEIQQSTVDAWAQFFNIDPTVLSLKDLEMPLLVSVRTSSGYTVLYPTALIFVKTDIKASPPFAAGTEGMTGFNRGLIEDFGSKLARHAYYEDITDSRTQFVDYWAYRDPKHKLEERVFNTLVNGPLLKDITQLKVDTPRSEPQMSQTPKLELPSPNNEGEDDEMLKEEEGVKDGLGIMEEKDEDKTRQQEKAARNLSLGEYMLTHFMKGAMDIELPEEEEQQQQPQQEEIMPTPNTENTPEIMSKYNQQQQQQQQQQTNDSTATSTVSPEPQIDYIDSTWQMDSFEDLDFTVTEADFDFFESPVITTSTPVTAAVAPTATIKPELSSDSLPQPTFSTPSIHTNVISNQQQPMEIEDFVKEREENIGHQLNTTSIQGQHVAKVDTEMQEQDKKFRSDNDPMQIDNDDLNKSIKEEVEKDVEGKKIEKENVFPTNNTISDSFKKNDPNHITLESMTKSDSYQFIPSEFRPVPLTPFVNDNKYEAGGKYTYPKTAIGKPKSKRKMYHPDYIPALKRNNSNNNINKKEVEDDTKNKSSSTSGKSGRSDVIVIDDDDDDDDDSSSCDSDCSTCDGTSSSGSSSHGGSNSEYESNSEEEEEEEEGQEGKKEGPNTDTTDRPELNIQKFKKSIVSYLVSVTRAEQPTDSLQRLEHDTPFSHILTGLSVKPIKWRYNRAMSQSLDFLCQQAVWGGYPFAGGLSELSSNGGGLLSDPAKIMMLRRANLMQMTRGKVNHTSSIPPDWSDVVTTFKNVLTQLFIEKEEEKEGEGQIEAATSFLNEIHVSSTVDIKGPLNINQYFSLEDSGQQVHPKYGKFQVKKKRSTLPNLRQLELPEMTVNRNDTMLEGSVRMFPFWEKLGLSPVSSIQKNVRYFVIYPQNQDVERTVLDFFKDLSAMYEACHLGIHRPGNAENYRNGLVPVPLIDLTDVTNIKKRLKSYEDTCEKFGKILAQGEKYKNQIYTVIYMINPGPYLSSNLDMCHCFYKLKEMYQSVLQSHPLNTNNTFVLQLLPMEHLIRPSAFGGYLPQGLKEIAFSVYCKCPATAPLSSSSTTTAKNTYTPLFVLSKKIPEKIEYKMTNIRHFPVVINQDITIHMTYCFSFNRNWMAVVWVDGQGNQLEHALFDRKTAYKEAWNRTLDIFQQYSLPGRIVITKIGLMFEDELLYWLRYTSQKKKNQVVIVSLDIETGLGLHFDESNSTVVADGDDDAQKRKRTTTQSMPLDPSSQRGGNGNRATAGMMNGRKTDTLIKQDGHVQSLVLNHRVLYSQKRERAYKSILRTEALSETESWIMPLATGYLIHHLGLENDINPAFEQANTEPFIAEVHLIYNRTPTSAYTTLQNLLQEFYSLSFIDPVTSCGCLPYHVVLAERLSRLLLIVDNYSIQN